MAENALLKETEKENEFLREALGVGLQKEFRLALAEVIGKDIGQDAILVNQGSKDGILAGMPVITQQKTLLGKVSEVYDDFSWVILISNNKSSFDAKVVQSGVAGVIKGQGNSKINFDLVPQNEEIFEGELVVSSSLGGLYPAGLLVGSIKKIEQSDVKPFYRIAVSPFFDIQELAKVLIILNF
jgi:rod shape-determining protein MreC